MKKFLILFVAIIFPMIYGCSTEEDPIIEEEEQVVEEEEEEVAVYDFSLTVHNTQDNPIEGAEVTLYDSSEAAVATETTNADGVVTFSEIEAGEQHTYSVSFDGVTSSGNFTLSDGHISQTVALDIEEEEQWTQNSPIIITGIHADPRGADGAVAGSTTDYEDEGVTIEHAGGYEYIQLMALEDINFAETPYSVVVATNGYVTAKGWAEGGKRTFKFNLTSGEAAAGEFFYVGGNSKVISGYGPCGKSTDISDANWIRTIDYLTEGGDGFGEPPSGLLGNVTNSGANTADGIAVFEGTEVTEESVPLDAVFFGSKVHAAYNEEEGWGYKVPVSNDHYSAVNPETGEAQPLFGQGTNTTFLAQGPNKDSGEYSKLGGATSRTEWISPRETTVVGLSYCPGESSLSDIEAGQGITSFIKE